MKSTESSRLASGVGTDCRIPRWAAGLISGLSRDLPTVLTREEILERLTNSQSKRDIDSTINELRRLGWLVGLPVHGVWAFIPAGQDELADPYLALRAWLARAPDAGLRLAGAAAAWHLGYLERAPDRPTAIWLPATTRLPDGLRPYVSLVQIKWASDAASVVGPTTRLLLQRKLDIVSWASGLPAFAQGVGFNSTDLKTGISNSLAVIMMFGFVLGIAAVIVGGFAIRRGDVDQGKMSIIGGAIIAAAPAVIYAFFKIFGLDTNSTVGVGQFN